MQLNNTPTILKVSELNAEVALLLQSAFPLLWVEGEISNLSRPSSGHLYFSLKDSKAQVRCAMFKNRNLLLKIKPENGLKVLARVRVGLYEPRGEYQLIVEHMEDAGAGKLQREFEALKKKLQDEGLFAQGHKQALPAFPRRIGVITSPTGAAIRDVINVLKRRCPAMPILIYGVPVQGEQAAPNIVKAIQQANHDRRCDVLLLVRGGGSAEDLSSFNDETVARAVFGSELPIVSGVGHEVDFTIVDFVSDQRAPTPSAAAELISPDAAALYNRTKELESRLRKLHQQLLKEKSVKLQMLNHRLGRLSGLQSIRQNRQRIDELELRLRRNLLQQIEQRKRFTGQLQQRVLAQSPIRGLQQQHTRLEYMQRRLHESMEKQLQSARENFHRLSAQLHAISPLATLQRGYAIASLENKVVRSVEQLNIGDRLNIRFADGTADCDVKHIGRSKNQQ